MMPRAPVAILMLAGIWLSIGAAAAAESQFSRRLCASLAEAVSDLAPDGGPVFLASYRPVPGEALVPQALRSTAFSYDNALAVIALFACGQARAATQIAEAFRIAQDSDRTFRDGRFRNAYRAGRVTALPVLLPGWWDGQAGHWAEDRYQDGSATGNVAWVGLALMEAFERTGASAYRDAAHRAAAWIGKNTGGAAIGFTGGVEGFDPEQVPLPWASVEHNIDVLALATRLLAHGDDPTLAAAGRSARAFLDGGFDPATGCFRMGTAPDGTWRDLSEIALDTQLWPTIAVADRPPAWDAALACAERRLSVPGGFDFNDDRDGLWVEGTAQAALTYDLRGRRAEATALLNSACEQVSPSGWLYATRESRLTTGLRIGPWSQTADFFYFRRPHLGATAWAALAATGHNPFHPRTTSN